MPLHGVGVDVPLVEGADHGHPLGIGRPDRKAGAALDEMGAEEAIGPAMLAAVEEVDVQLGQGRLCSGSTGGVSMIGSCPFLSAAGGASSSIVDSLRSRFEHRVKSDNVMLEKAVLVQQQQTAFGKGFVVLDVLIRNCRTVFPSTTFSAYRASTSSRVRRR